MCRGLSSPTLRATSSASWGAGWTLRRPNCLGEALDDGDVGLAAAFAHGLKAVAAAGALELVEQRGHQADAGGTQGVAQGDGAAVDVDLGQVGAGLFLPRQHDGG